MKKQRQSSNYFSTKLKPIERVDKMKKFERKRNKRFLKQMGKNEKGITLVALVITIIVIIILSAATLYALFKKDGIIEHAKFSRYATEYRGVEEQVELYWMNAITENLMEVQVIEENGEKSLPVGEEIKNDEKNNIKEENPSLAVKVQELSGKAMEEVKLYWVDLSKLDCKANHRYIIDIETRQLYNYEPEVIYDLNWHTLDDGVEPDRKPENMTDEEIWDGWITLTLYYPAGSTDRQWRLGEEGETRYDENLAWKDYTGPITVRLSDVENVWIRYNLNGEEVIIPPSGRVLVDIQPDSWYPNMVDKVKIKIAYDKSADLKEYKVGNGPWQEYEGEFYVTENTIVEARARVTDTLSDSKGNIVGQQERWGRDNIYVQNIGIEESDLSAPTIRRKTATEENEVAKVEITYPEGAERKIYKINYGEEKEYTEEVSIQKYGTHVLAYYYDASGKRSKATQIIIDEEGKNQEGESYVPNRPGSAGGSNPTKPSYVVPGPEIVVSPTSIISSETGVTVTLEIPEGYDAEKTYIKIGNNSYQEYTGAINLKYNTTIYAYYTTTKGERSSRSIKRVNNIRQPNKPYIRLEADPDPYDQRYNATEVEISIYTQDANTVEYSLNGIEYQTYTAPFTVTQNCRVYGRATNNYGTTVEYIDITNIKGGPQKVQSLSVSINAEPEPQLTTELVDKVKISIDYDERATKKYYSIGAYGKLQEYTGPFEITQNCTVYGYALSDNGKGQAHKIIDNLYNGIAEPEITGSPRNGRQAGKVKISINYDRNATVKQYKIDGGVYQDYTGEFEVTENCTIYAYNSNSRGDQAESSYTVSNIVAEIPTVIIDKGDYYIIKLNYPEGSTGREYKWQQDGEWKSYPEDGILLVKPEYKDKLIGNNGEVKVKIENEEGEEIDFKGDWYLIDRPFQELMENIFMRWDRSTPNSPTILLNTQEPAREVTVTIQYSSSLLVREYRIVEPDGTSSDWMEYTGSFTVDKKNTIIYARGQDEAEVWSGTAMKQITNIDEEPPVIKVSADLENTAQRVGMRIEVTDDVRVETVAWAKGIRGESYFETGGNVIPNNSIVTVEENGYYTIYAEDGVGNKQVYTILVENVDLTPPDILITVEPENKLVTQITVSIDYGDSSQQEYKVGESNNTWSSYTGEFDLTSYTVLANNWQNEDGTVTIYARGKDSVGNETLETKKVISLDLDAPAEPVIESAYGYPILTEYGVITNGETSITYDTRQGIENYYSLDNGGTWLPYTGAFNIPGEGGTVMAKSVKTSSGLETIVSREINMPEDAIGPAAYDGDDETYANVGPKETKYMEIDESIKGKNIQLMGTLYDSSVKLEYENGSITTIAYYRWGEALNMTYTIPIDAKRLVFTTSINGEYGRINEIRVANEPKINATSHYPKLTEYGVETSYNEVTIDYNPTSVQKLYKIDEGEWKKYNGETIRLEIGQTIYAKGIDKNGDETRIISSYTSAELADAIGLAAYDGVDETYANVGPKETKYMEIDESIKGKNIQLMGILYNSYVKLEHENGSITTIAYYRWGEALNMTYTIPIDAKRLVFTTNVNGKYGRINEIRVLND